MTGKHIYQILLSLLCILLAVLICRAAVGIYREGSRRKAEDPLETVYAKEAVEDVSAHLAPLLIVTAVMAAGGILAGVRDDRKVHPPGKMRNVRRDRQICGFPEADEPAGTKIYAADTDNTPGRLTNRKTQTILRAVLLTAAILCIIAGIFNGGMQDVFVKAANICSECIGLG